MTHKTDALLVEPMS